MSEFNYSDYCIKSLFKEIRELNNLKGEYKEDIEYIIKDDIGAHALYERVFCKYVLELINKKNLSERDSKIIDRSFEFIEKLANHEEHEVKCVAKVSFIEPLLAYIQPTKKIEDYLLPRSLKMAKDIGIFRFGFNPDTWEKEEY